MSEANEPPPDVVPPEHRELWRAAVVLLQQNMGLTILSKDDDLAVLSDNSDDECENGGMAQERDSQASFRGKAHGACVRPVSPATPLSVEVC
jgi:hypothetical protein